MKDSPENQLPSDIPFWLFHTLPSCHAHSNAAPDSRMQDITFEDLRTAKMHLAFAADKDADFITDKLIASVKE